MKKVINAIVFCFQVNKITLILVFSVYTNANAQVNHWKTGDKVEAGPNGYHPATVLEVSKAGVSFRLHYEDNAHPDDWVEGYWIRARNTQAKADAAAANGPLPGKYLIYSYATSFGAYNGYFIMESGGAYEVFLAGGKSTGKGRYSFDKVNKVVKWNSGPFANKDWDGTQKLEVSREGKTYIIRLKARTIGTYSTDSKVK